MSDSELKVGDWVKIIKNAHPFMSSNYLNIIAAITSIEDDKYSMLINRSMSPPESNPFNNVITIRKEMVVPYENTIKTDQFLIDIVKEARDKTNSRNIFDKTTQLLKDLGVTDL